MNTWLWVSLAFLLLMSAFFSGMEIAYVTANKLKLELDKKKDNLTGRILRIITRHPADFITTMLVGNNIALVAYGIYSAKVITDFLEKYFPGLSEFESLVVQSLLSGIIILVLAEFLPKILFQLYANTSLRVFAVPTLIVFYVFRPVSWLVIKLSDALIKIFTGGQNPDYAVSLSKSELRKYLDKQLNANTPSETENEMQILSNALEFSNVKAREIMVPRTKIVAVDIRSKPSELIPVFTESGHSKILAYDDNIDNIKGYIHFFDLFKKPSSLDEILRSVLRVPESISIEDLLKKMNKNKKSIAVVFEEYGGTAGLVTLEDIMEKIFGEIEDEHDKDDELEKQLDENTYIFSAGMDIDEINQKYKLNLPRDEDFESLGGYILELFGRIPRKGEQITDDEYRYTVLEADNNRIEKIKIQRRNE
ncbi:MAG: HlyC/CorC family transporter [Chlorobi bacterium]|nr:HlyC/CorC family transporter [Chlorobiota bacterium]